MSFSLTKPANTLNSSSGNRVPGIDVLRGLCIIAVVLLHINLRIHFRDSILGHWIGPAANHVLFWSGYYGVRVFFVISGFLITTWSLKRWGALARINRRQFYLMRFARIVPCLIGLLVLLSILDRLNVQHFIVSQQHSTLGRALLAALTFHVNWLEARHGYLPANWDVLWSLSVEEVFYIFFPLLCTLLRKQALIIALLGCLVVIGPYARVHTQNELWSDYGYLSCMDGIAFGCLAAILSAAFRFARKQNLALAISGTSLLVFIGVFRGSAHRLGFYKIGLDVTILELGTALLLIALQQQFENQSSSQDSLANQAARSKPQKLAATLSRSTAFLRWFGRNSYEVYLTHMLVVWPIVVLFFHFKLGINTSWLWFLAATALAGLLGGLIARFYSEPLNRRLRSGLSSAQTKTVLVAAD
jgi:peptidoglycan/LPS O-acetylase OafA/YrhL